MKFLRLSLLPALLCGSVSLAHGATTTPIVGEYVPGEILVRVSQSGAGAVHRYVANTGAKTLHNYAAIGWQRIKLPKGISVEAAIASYQKQAGVLGVEPNYKIYAQKVANDPYLQNGDIYGMTNISAPAAWDVTTGGTDVVVAVCDSGIKYDHPDLAANMWHNPKEIPNNGKDDDGNGIVDDYYGFDAFNQDGNPMDDNGHGTHCAGVIGAVGNNKLGVVGINWKAKMMAIKILSADGSSTSTDSIDGYEYAIAQKKRGVNLRVISNSWGGLGMSSALKDVMQEAADNGIISICAAGNDGINNDNKGSFPTNFDVDGLVAVGASDENDNPASFSNYGKKRVDLFAPGVHILSTWINSKGSGLYNYESGTSMACPQVAGAAALLLSKAPGLSVTDIKSRLVSSVDKLPQLKNYALSGGRLNLAKLLGTGLSSISGTVFGPNKKPLAGAQIFLNGSKVAADVSDTDGTYEVAGLKGGTYSAKATLKGWTFTPSPAQVTLGDTKGTSGTINFNGKSTTTVYSFSGTVYQLIGTEKKPLQGAKIYLGKSSTDPVAETDADGKYVVTGRVGGTYYVFAKLDGYDLRGADQISLDGSAKVVLPAKNGSNIADFVSSISDTLAPNVTVSAPTYGTTYSQLDIRRAFGTAYDKSGVASIDFSLSRVEGEGSSFYLWKDKKWSKIVYPDADGFTLVPDGAMLTQEFDGTNVSWSVPFPELEAGEYRFSNFSMDKLGNRYIYDFPVVFDVTTATTTEAFPTVNILTPNSSTVVASGKSVTAKGTAKDAEGVGEVYVYLRRYDEQGGIIGYYNWTSKAWDETNDDPRTLKVITGNKKPDFSWSAVLPPMVPGDYQLGAFARDIYGAEPAEDGSQDVLSSFTVKKADSTSNAKSAGETSANKS